MNTTTILIQAIAALGGLAMVIGIVLVMASKVFKVETNPLVDEVLDVLPGANCGACGYAGCGEFAEQVVEDNAPITGCPLGGFEVEEKIGGILGKEVGGEEDIIEVIVRPRFPFAYYTGGDVDSIMSNIYMQWMFQRGRHAGFNDFLGDYYITLSTEKDYNIILGTEIRWRFYNGRIFMNPEPTGMDVILVFKSALTIEEINTNALIREYSLGEAKKVLGNIRSTFGGSIPAGTETIDLNGDALKSEGKEEVDAALEKMKGLMEPFGFDFG